MPDPSEELITILVEIHNGTHQAIGPAAPSAGGAPSPEAEPQQVGRVGWRDQPPAT